MLCFTCGSWLFRMDRIFLPSLTSCSLGLINIIYNLTITPNPKLNGNFAAAVSLAAISTVLYGTAAIFTFRKISRVRKPRTNYRALSPWQDDALWIPEDERTRQQLLRLLLKPGPDKAPSPAATQDTFRIDLPDASAEERDANGYLTMPRNVYESRSRSNSGATRELGPWERLQGRDRSVGSPRPDGRPPSREDRRVEIEMSERGYNDARGYTRDGVNFIPRINRVQTDGWGAI
ncbi:MAG: hypothetical protein M1836_001773 [Candelina mexicana]|nr:MAG: hypothetical protein M1836_001773 [Candelina mexicana]